LLLILLAAFEAAFNFVAPVSVKETLPMPVLQN
jgi:hypothetical protein